MSEKKATAPASTAKNIDLPRGTMAEVSRRLGIHYNNAVQGWKYERPEVVEMVHKVVKEYVAAEQAVKTQITEISQLTQSI